MFIFISIVGKVKTVIGAGHSWNQSVDVNVALNVQSLQEPDEWMRRTVPNVEIRSVISVNSAWQGLWLMNVITPPPQSAVISVRI